MSSMRCQVYWARPAVATPRLIDLLDQVERSRHDTYHRAADRARFLTGRVVTKSIVAAALDIPVTSVVLDSTCADCGKNHGKPKVVAPPGFAGTLPELSISHSGDLVGVAVTDGLPVGLDVEQERDVQIDGLVRMTLSPAELESFETVREPDRDAAFFTYWARKEAVLKATGKGLAVPMTKITLAPWDQPPRLLASQASEVDIQRMRLAPLDPARGYRACVAVIADPGFPSDGWVAVHDGDPLVAELS
jgi:4'-phosphopantetheinyl transferase